MVSLPQIRYCYLVSLLSPLEGACAQEHLSIVVSRTNDIVCKHMRNPDVCVRARLSLIKSIGRHRTGHFSLNIYRFQIFGRTVNIITFFPSVPLTLERVLVRTPSHLFIADRYACVGRRRRRFEGDTRWTKLMTIQHQDLGGQFSEV